jgi:hypothetical protein
LALSARCEFLPPVGIKHPSYIRGSAHDQKEIRQVIEAAREQTAQAVNSTLVMMYWQIGKRIRLDVLGNERADYGKQVVQTVSTQLTAEYGKGFTEKALWRMM